MPRVVPQPIAPSLPREFTRRWQSCHACQLHVTARKHVIGRGSLPADVLFVGESPGEKEDLRGEPFVGPAGKLLDQIVEQTIRRLKREFTGYYTNTVACCPWTDANRDDWREPKKDEADACRPRLDGLLEYVRPKLIVHIGAVAKRLFKGHGLPNIQIIHPSSILRMDVPPVNTVEYHQSVIYLAEAVEEFIL